MKRINRIGFMIATALLFSAMVLLNITNLPVIWGLEPPFAVYHYISSDGGYEDVEAPWKGRHFDSVVRGFNNYREEHARTDVVLCRNFERTWWRFWCWYDYLTNERWDCPVASQ